jgi:hypothetical protein
MTVESILFSMQSFPILLQGGSVVLSLQPENPRITDRAITEANKKYFFIVCYFIGTKLTALIE